jgi:hypothetical protein
MTQKNRKMRFDRKVTNVMLKGLSLFLAVLLVVAILIVVTLAFDDTIMFNCEKYEQVPYRYSGGFFNQQVRTTEGNHDGYWNQCVDGDSFSDLFFNYGRRE